VIREQVDDAGRIGSQRRDDAVVRAKLPVSVGTVAP
jgi:hypothetical protein